MVTENYHNHLKSSLSYYIGKMLHIAYCLIVNFIGFTYLALSELQLFAIAVRIEVTKKIKNKMLGNFLFLLVTRLDYRRFYHSLMGFFTIIKISWHFK